MQEFFRELNVAGDAEYELLEVSSQGVLHYGKVRAVLIYMSDNRHVYYGQTSVNRNFLNLFPERVQLILDE